ncbi:MAG TPA: hypothetical protein VHZ03_06095 [Trebonia sp.]|nr:hypothetical protein [Trebonia sp.]
MNHIRRILAAVATLAGTVTALATAPAAYASLPPHGGGADGAPTTVPVIAAGGMPGWQIALIAVAAAVVAAAVAVLIDRAWVARRTHATTA